MLLLEVRTKLESATRPLTPLVVNGPEVLQYTFEDWPIWRASQRTQYRSVSCATHLYRQFNSRARRRNGLMAFSVIGGSCLG